MVTRRRVNPSRCVAFYMPDVSSPSGRTQALDLPVKALEFRLQYLVGCGESVHDSLCPVKIFPLSFDAPIGRRAGNDGSEVRNFVRQLDDLCPNGFLGCGDDLKPLPFCLRSEERRVGKE